jgi:hypothetical protein
VVAVDIAADYDGAPLSVLSDLIRDRQKYLGESAADAVIATGIDALNSMRALTRVAPRTIPRRDVRWGKTDPQYLTNARGSFRRTVVTRWRNGRRVNVIKWKKVEGTTKRGKPRATSADRRAAWERWGKVKNSGLARRALGIAMNRLSTRQVKDDRTNMRLARIAAANVMVRKTDTGGSFMLQIRDGLGYAVQALQGGPASIDLALKRAENKIAGRLCKVAERKFGERVATPFPEVKGRRAR